MSQDSTPEPNPPNLATLREMFGRVVPDDRPLDKGGQIAPGHWRKVYGPAPATRFMLRPTRWNLRKEGREFAAPEAIAQMRDDRTLLQLRSQVDEPVGQIIPRAAAGDKEALSLLVNIASGIIKALETVEKAQSQSTQAVAEELIEWPVLLGRKKASVTSAQDQLERLKLGTKAATPWRKGQKLDSTGYWARLASQAFQACQDNQKFIPVLESQCEGITPIRWDIKFWGTTMQARFYDSPTDYIVITDWEKQCEGLSLPVTEINLQSWWYVIRHYALEYWHGFPDEYAKALCQIGHADEEEWRQRNLAVDRLEQIFRDLVGLR